MLCGRSLKEDRGNNTRPSVGLTLVFFIQHLDGLRSEHKDAKRPSLSPFTSEFTPRLNPAVERRNVLIRGINVRNEVAVTWSPPLGPSVVAFVLKQPSVSTVRPDRGEAELSTRKPRRPDRLPHRDGGVGVPDWQSKHLIGRTRRLYN